ncbi:hypothetical protein DCAR_0313458 [Daucus carota subsp. sativus]|uniref:non-specific serine/threonine protein kinase n=1 Tax=Daucus carota subsp. sativus TaxID=79200 RepID=A0AAF0WU54_DAUCS|nr:hypothetical protein DCAR_0313458 [Daucus carota subsp. sativus]
MEISVGNKFRLGKKIGRGYSGEIYSGTNMRTNEEVAIKLESVKTKHPQLLYESKLYAHLHGGTGIPDIKWFGVEGDYNVMVMNLLGPSLENLFDYCGRKFSLKTVLMLADQMINRVEFVHSKSFLHRDIKPDNFLMGLQSRANQVSIIDFGIGKKYRDRSTHQHIPYRENKNLTGTARFASRNTHLGIEQSRRDDMESLGFVFMYFLRGSLPWQGMNARTKKEKYERISKKKVSTSNEALCHGFPTEFSSYFNYCHSLQFEDEPDYAYLKRAFRDLFIQEGFQFDYVFDWTVKKYPQMQTTAKFGTLEPTAGSSIAIQSTNPNVDPQLGDKEVRQGFSSIDLCGRSSHGQDLYRRVLSKQKSPVVSDLLKGKDMLPSSSSLGRAGGLFRQAGVSSSWEPFTGGNELDPLHSLTAYDPSDGLVPSFFTCDICVEQKPFKESFPVKGCTHYYCSDCVHKYVELKLQFNITQIPCPDSGCNGLLELEHCQSILPPEVFNRWGDALCEALILVSPKFYCPFKDCSEPLIQDADSNGIVESECPSCRRLFCAKCKVPWHSGIKCVEFQKLHKNERESGDIMLMQLAKKNKWTRCPKCKFYVERSEGCLFMKCRSASHLTFYCISFVMWYMLIF